MSAGGSWGVGCGCCCSGRIRLCCMAQALAVDVCFGNSGQWRSRTPGGAGGAFADRQVFGGMPCRGHLSRWLCGWPLAHDDALDLGWGEEQGGGLDNVHQWGTHERSIMLS